MLRLPHFIAVFLILSITGVSKHFVSLPAAFAGAMTGITVAIFLIFDSRIGYKEAMAMHATHIKGTLY